MKIVLVILAIYSIGFAEETTVDIFRNTMCHFNQDTASKYLQTSQTAADNGRVISTVAELPSFDQPVRITALLTLKPTVKDERQVFDRYDRAGNIRLAIEGEPELEVVRFMTSYGGETSHEIDVSYLKPLLTGKKTFRAFVDTWSSPGWTVDFSLKFTTDTAYENSDWVLPIFYSESFNAEKNSKGEITSLDIPSELGRVALIYISTGHCTDGVDEDEFISKPNVISVDGKVVERFYPWRTDCRKYRERNPYCARWTDGSWSSDYSRCGWCPGCEVVHNEFDLTDHFNKGKHKVKFEIKNMRPKNENGDYGYWRVSGYLVGWKKEPKLWRNY